MSWKEVKEGKDICPRCKIGILSYHNSDDAKNDIHECDRCFAKFKWRKENENYI